MSKKTKTPPARWPEKAYKNLDFLTSPDARTLRVLAEFLEPAARFRRRNVRHTVVFFGSARLHSPEAAREALQRAEAQAAAAEGGGRVPLGVRRRLQAAERDLDMSRYYEDAAALAERITRWSLGIRDESRRFYVCSGGGGGIMEAANRGARRAGGKSIGLNISLPFEQEANSYQTPELAFEFHYFFVRKFWFFYLAKALVAFPGGYGTLDELFELLTLVQTRKTRKVMPIVLYGSRYWDRVLNLRALAEAGTISPGDLKIFRTFDDVDAAFTYLKEELTRHYLRSGAPEEPLFPDQAVTPPDDGP